MKRLNPTTGKAFVKGDVREDGYIFGRYAQTIKKDGYFIEQWNKPNNVAGRKRNNPETGEPFKKGDVRHDGYKFKEYTKLVQQDGYFVEVWLRDLEPKKGVGKKRINPETGKLFRRGDKRSDGYWFDFYKNTLRNDGYYSEQWRKPNTTAGEKRKNPETGKLFREGEFRKDGKRFKVYQQRIVNSDGYFKEVWIDADAATWDGLQTGSIFTKPELRIYTELKSVFGNVELRYREFDNLEIDVYLPELKFGIEYDGARWHKGKEKHDRAKTNKLSNLGIKIVRLRCLPLAKITPDDLLINDNIPLDKK